MARTKTGIVTSAKSEKTITVNVDSYENHPKYHKRYLVSTKFRAHDEEGKAKEGDKVVITEARPSSATKRWTLTEIINKQS